MVRRLSLLISIVCCGIGAAGAQDVSPAATALFARAKAAYGAGQYDSTIAMLKTFIRKNGKDPATEYLVPLMLEALTRKSDVETSPKLIEIYLNRFPQSSFAPRVRYLGGVLKARQEDYLGSVIAFSGALAGGLPPVLDSLVFVDIRLLADKSLSPGDVENLMARPDLDGRIVELLRFVHIGKLFDAGRNTAAAHEADDFIREYPRSAQLPTVKDIANRCRAQQRGQVPVGFLGPLSGYDAEVGAKVLRGAQLAIERHNQTQSNKINLIIADTRGSMTETALRTHELVDDQRAQVIIGPVLSQTSVVCAAMLMGKEAVMVSPTATDERIADLGKNIFQVNLTMGVLGRRIAEYAMRNLNISEFAVIAPNADYGRSIAESFRDEVKKNGAEIVAEEYFDEGTNNFRPQFQALRNILIQRKVAREATDPAGALGKQQRRPFKSDSATYADSIMSIGAIFMPAEVEDVVMLAPEMPFFKLKGQLLGATGWHNDKTVQDGRQYVNNAVIVTTGDLDKNDAQWADFASRYQARYATEPDRIAALGYDAADLVCRAIAALGGDPGGRQIGKALHAVQGYKGVSGMISFDENHGANREAAIVKILDKKFVRIQ